MTHTPTNTWEQDFDERFKDWKTPVFRTSKLDAKDFIRILLTSQRAEIVAEVLEEIQNMQGILWHDNIQEHARRIHRQNTLDEVRSKLEANLPVTK